MKGKRWFLVALLLCLTSFLTSSRVNFQAHAAPTIAIDGSALGTCHAGGLTSTVFTTTNTNDLLIFQVSTDNNGPTFPNADLESVASSPALTWTFRLNMSEPTLWADIEYYAIWPSSGSINITGTFGGKLGGNCNSLGFGITGYNTSTPFDPGFTCPAGTTILSGATCNFAHSGAPTSDTVTVTPSSAGPVMLLGLEALGQSTTGMSAATGMTQIIGTNGDVAHGGMEADYRVVDTSFLPGTYLVGATFTTQQFAGLIGDIICDVSNPCTKAAAPATSPLSIDGRSYVVPTSTGGCPAGAATITTNVTAANPDDVLIFGFAGRNIATTTLDNLTDTAGNTWNLRMNVTLSSSWTVQEWYTVWTGSGQDKVTAAFGSTSRPSNCSGVLFAVSGANPSSPFATGFPVSSSTTAGTSLTTNQVVHNQGQAMLIGLFGGQAAKTFTAGTGYSSVVSSAATSDMYAETQAQLVYGNYQFTPTASWTTNEIAGSIGDVLVSSQAVGGSTCVTIMQGCLGSSPIVDYTIYIVLAGAGVVGVGLGFSRRRRRSRAK